jgi:hypothetical protein
MVASFAGRWARRRRRPRAARFAAVCSRILAAASPPSSGARLPVPILAQPPRQPCAGEAAMLRRVVPAGSAIILRLSSTSLPAARHGRHSCFSAVPPPFRLSACRACSNAWRLPVVPGCASSAPSTGTSSHPARRSTTASAGSSRHCSKNARPTNSRQRRAVARHAAHRDHLALVVESDRHRPQQRPAGDRAHRTRHRLPPRGGAASCRPAERAAIAALLHDRMLETVLDDFAQTADLFRHFAPRR